MKRGYFLWTYTRILFIIFIIIAIILAGIYFFKKEYDIEQFETIKTDMLLIEAKTKIVAEKVRIKEENASYIGKKLEEVGERTDIKELQDKEIIDLNSKDKNYYILEKSHLDDLGLTTIKVEEGYYIVEYNSNEIIYSKGVENKEGERLYKLSDIQKYEIKEVE